MKLLVIGTLLVLYSIFLSPAFFEPSDVIVSTGYIAIANNMGIDPIWIWLWIMSGYVALIGGVILGVGGAFLHFKHPVLILSSVMIFAGILSYWLLFVSGIV